MVERKIKVNIRNNGDDKDFKENKDQIKDIDDTLIDDDQGEISQEEPVIDDPAEEIEKMKQKAEGNYDLYVRTLAEIENLKKRHSKEKQDWHKFANEKLIKDILPVIDNLEKAISHSNDENSLEALRQGIELTLKSLMAALENAGLKEVKTDGEAFDPCFHQAVSEQKDKRVDAGLILHELQKGYLLNERLIRPSMVIVSKGAGKLEKECDMK